MPAGGRERANGTSHKLQTALPPSTVTPKTASATATVTPGHSGSPARPTSISSPPSPHSLSGGAIVGIAIGGACAVLVAFGISVWLFRRRKGGDTAAIRPSIVEKDSVQVPSNPLLPRYQGTEREMVSNEAGGSLRMEDPTRMPPTDRHREAELPG